MPDRITDAERAAILAYTGPITTCPPAHGSAGLAEPMQPREAILVQVRGRQQRRVEE